MVSAELALAVPALVAVVTMLAWMLALGVTQGVVAQAAREAARAAARGDSAHEVRSAAIAVVPDAVVTVRRAGPLLQVTASVTRQPPLRLLSPLRRTVRATATTWVEP